MPRTTVIELYKEEMKFSAGHFTIFSATERERLHGHNFRVQASMTCEVGEDGLAFDYAIYKRRIFDMCAEWNEYFMLPERSPHLRLEKTDDYLIAHFDGDRIPFLYKDVMTLPVANVTVEELSQLVLVRLVEFRNAEQHLQVSAIEVKVFSGPGQSASANWKL